MHFAFKNQPIKIEHILGFFSTLFMLIGAVWTVMQIYDYISRRNTGSDAQ